MNVEEVRCGYDAVARAYHGRFGHELSAKPFDREWLDDLVEALDPGSRVVEVGCGDGHVADYLSRSTLRVEGLDVSPAMIGVAREAYPDLSFVIGDILALPYRAESLDAVVSFYSIVNLEPADCRAAFKEFARVLRRGGMATIAF
ncbi:MAG: class I SAM-dependent methyltransferase, partial [Gammaproteobacteria bacterium]